MPWRDVVFFTAVAVPCNVTAWRSKFAGLATSEQRPTSAAIGIAADPSNARVAAPAINPIFPGCVI